MKSLRTPDERFANLDGYDFEPNYLDDLEGYEGLRMHYIDIGPRDAAETFLCLHGEPTWSYLYRRMIPTLVGAGHRIIAPDLIGFGRSDKPTERSAYTYNGHVAWMHEFLDRLLETDPDIGPFAAFLQDWGGLIGLRVAAESPDRFAYLCAGNTALPDLSLIHI